MIFGWPNKKDALPGQGVSFISIGSLLHLELERLGRLVIQ
jgi:hypothetical protein